MENKLKSVRLIEVLKKFLVLYIGLTGLMPILVWSQDVLGIGSFLNTSLAPHLLKALGSGQRIVGWFVDSIQSGLFIMVLIFFYKLLELIRRGQPFSKVSIGLYEKIARYYLFSIIYEPIAGTLMSVITTWHMPVGQRTISIAFGTGNINSILLAFCLYLIIFLIKQAHQISEEQRMVI